jgi:hypothetical protein
VSQPRQLPLLEPSQRVDLGKMVILFIKIAMESISIIGQRMPIGV